MKTFPMQPLVVDPRDGTVRFQANRIVRVILDSGKLNMNDLAMMAAQDLFTDAEQMQFAQLIGYSVGGFAELSYADPATVTRAENKAADLLQRQRDREARRAQKKR